MRSTPENALLILHSYLQTDEFQGFVDNAQGGYILEAIKKAKQELDERGGPLQSQGAAAMRMLSPGELSKPEKDRRPIKAVVYSSNRNNLRDVSEVLYNKLARSQWMWLGRPMENRP